MYIMVFLNIIIQSYSIGVDCSHYLIVDILDLYSIRLYGIC